MKARAKLVLPVPSSPERPITSPVAAWRASLRARRAVAVSSGRSMARAEMAVTGLLLFLSGDWPQQSPEIVVAPRLCRSHGSADGAAGEMRQNGGADPSYRCGDHRRRPRRPLRHLRMRHAENALP